MRLPPVAGGATGSEDTADTISELVRDLGASGRSASAQELGRLRTFFADQVLPTEHDLAANTSAGRYARSKYAEHVRRREEWPPGTSPAEYPASLRATVQSQASGIRLYQHPQHHQWMLLFVARTRRAWQGPAGFSSLVVLFNAENASWVTGFQVNGSDRYIRRRGGWWLKSPG
jgi:hypothetical protein